MIDTAKMLEVFKRYRDDAIVVPGRGGSHWVNLTDAPSLDATLGDPAMGGHAAFGLGIALAQPARRVYLFDSDGDIQMSMGMLTTIAEQAPKNLYHFVLDNEVYATTGGQPVPNAGRIDYAGIAAAAGYQHARSYSDLDELTRELDGIFATDGPYFIHLRVRAEIQNEAIGTRKPWNPRERGQVIADLREALSS
jgi:thiamine pyrophosphate-dependent acetolactate synthase large subunit-like protein